ncbi:unnamed protein product [marine sediment metagenome]|uniref:Uncharacterized protein n=1 Tax=marine sediment metagenome TaxID=412755 RepID=X1QZM9_9ZZZZ
MPGEDIAGILAQQKLQERDRQEFTQKIEAISGQVKNVEKNVQAEMKKIGQQVQSIGLLKGDSETLKKWPTLTEAEKQVSPLIPRNAYQTQLQAIFAEQENIPGLKRRLAELYTKEDAEKLLSEDSTGEKFAEAICTSEECKVKVKGKVEEYQESHGQKKQRGFWD